MDRSRNSNRICKPKMMDCIGCPENTDYKNSFCSSSKKCIVPYALVVDGKVDTWLENTDFPNGWKQA